MVLGPVSALLSVAAVSAGGPEGGWGEERQIRDKELREGGQGLAVMQNYGFYMKGLSLELSTVFTTRT